MKNLFKIFKIKKLNNKGMTLIEVLASVGILALIFVTIYDGTDLIIEGYKKGQFVYESNGKIEQRLEEGTDSTITIDKVSFTVNDKPVEVKGKYYTSSEKRDNMEVTLSLFKPD